MINFLVMPPTPPPPTQPYTQLLVQEDTPATSCPKCLLSKITEQYILTYRASVCYSSNRSGLLSCPVPWPFSNPHGFGPRPGPVPRPQFSPPQVGSSSPVPSAWPTSPRRSGVLEGFFSRGAPNRSLIQNIADCHKSVTTVNMNSRGQYMILFQTQLYYPLPPTPPIG